MDLKEMNVRLAVNKGMFMKRVERCMDGRNVLSDPSLSYMALSLIMIEIMINRLQGYYNLHAAFARQHKMLVAIGKASEEEVPENKSEEFESKIERAFILFEQLLDG